MTAWKKDFRLGTTTNYNSKHMLLADNVDEYVENSGEWRACLEALRQILQATELEEKTKWGMPTYCLNNKNVVGFSAFKEWSGLWFFQGVFLQDPHKKLINAQEGKTKGQRQWRFASLEEIRENTPIIRDYIYEAIENQRQGLEVKVDRNKPIVVPPELQTALDADRALKERFEGLSKGKKREYTEYIADAKRAETKDKRLVKILPMIAAGIGLNDKYR